jgi:hypothetical protein
MQEILNFRRLTESIFQEPSLSQEPVFNHHFESFQDELPKLVRALVFPFERIQQLEVAT